MLMDPAPERFQSINAEKTSTATIRLIKIIRIKEGSGPRELFTGFFGRSGAVFFTAAGGEGVAGAGGGGSAMSIFNS